MKKYFTSLILSMCLLLMSSTIFSQDYFGQIPFPTGENGQVIAVDLNNYVYIGVWGKGIMKSTDQGSTFLAKNNGLTNLLIQDITVTQTGKIYVTTMTGGIFRSNDGANTWSAVNNGLKTLNVTAIKEFPNGMMIAGTYGQGIFYSTNDGANWIQSNLYLPYRAISAIETSRNGKIVVGTYGAGVFVSRDTLKTWKRSNSGLGNLFIHKFAKNSVGDIFAATNGKGIYVSPTEGLSWGQKDTLSINDMNTTCVIITGSNEELIGTRNGGIQYWDASVYMTWRTPFQPMIGVSAFAKSSNNRIYAVGTAETPFVSTNNGRNWVPLGIIKTGENIQVFAPKNNIVLSQYANGSTYFSNDNGRTWQITNLPNKTLNAAVFTNSNTYVVGLQNGLFTSTDGITWTQSTRLVDTTVVSIAHYNGFMMISTEFQSIPDPPSEPPPPVEKLFVSTDGGANLTQSAYPSTDSRCDKLKIATNGNIFGKFGESIYRSTNNGSAWTKTTDPGSATTYLKDFDLDNSNFIFAATSDGLYRSQDYGQNWTYNSLNFLSQNNLYVAKVAASPNGKIYAVAGFARNDLFTAYGIWTSTNSGFDWDSINTSVTSNPTMNMAFSPEGTMYLGSNVLNRYYDPYTMDSPDGIYPVNQAKGIELNPTLIWNTKPKAELYEMQISEVENFAYLNEYVVQADSSYYLTDTLDFNKIYYWRVRSKTFGSYSNWSETFTFSTKLNAPILIAPERNSTGVSVNPIYLWHSVPNAEYYEFRLATDANFSNIVFFADSLKDSTLTSIELSSDITYYWQVKAKNKFSVSDWTDAWMFKTTFGAPELVFPPNDTLNIVFDPTFKWGKVENSTYYLLQYSKNKDFSDSIEVKTQKQEYLADTLDYITKYYWRVKTGSDEGESDFSPIWNFTVLAAPVVLLSPSNDAHNISTSPNLSFAKQDNFNNYQIVVGLDENFEQNVIDTLINVYNLNLTNLQGFKSYYWKVRINQTPTLGYWSDVFKFTTMINQPILRFPDNHSKNLPSEIQFLWFPQEGANQYFLQIARDATFNDLILSVDSIQTTSYTADGFAFNEKYYWRVRASNDLGFSEWCEPWDFETSSIRPTLLRPADNSINLVPPITVEWSVIDEADSYFLQIASDIDFNDLIISQDDLTSNQYEFQADYEKIYFWRVSVKINDYQSEWSTIWNFQTGVNSVKYIHSDNYPIYPNPVFDKFIVINANEPVYNITAVDILGNNIQLHNIIITNNAIEVDASNLSKGYYNLLIDFGTRIEVIKMIKE